MTVPASILIVDDEPRDCRLLQVLLGPKGYVTRTATSGEEALACIADDPPDLILLDVSMTGLDGHQVASVIKANPATSNIPIIMVTVDSDQQSRLAALDAGAEEFLTKPVDRAELWLRVRNLLRLKELGDLVERQAFDGARSMIESSLDSLVAINPDGMITDANEAMTKVTGFPRESVIGTAFSDYFTDPQKANAIYQLAFEQGMAVDHPLTLRHRDGTLTEVLYNASVYRDAGDKVLGIFAAARDVTKLIKAQRELAELYAREIEARTKDLERLAELERFQRLTVGRELKMIELKKQIEYLSHLVQAGSDQPVTSTEG